MTEEQIAFAIAEFWRADRAVYSEIAYTLNGTQYCVDLMGKSPGNLIGCECKRKLTAGLVDQCLRLKPHVNECWAAVGSQTATGGFPSPQQRENMRVIKESGIGLYRVNEAGTVNTSLIAESWPARTWLFNDLLTTQQQGEAAGVPATKRIKPDKWGSARLLIRNQPGLTTSELALLLSWTKTERTEWTRTVRRGEVKGVMAQGAPYRFYMEDVV